MVELLFAVMLCSLVLLGLIGVLASILRTQIDGRAYERVGVAASAIFGRAEQALSEDFERALIPDLFDDGVQPLENFEEIEFEVSETLERDDLKRVDLTIYWRDEKGDVRQKKLTTKFLRARR